jgi:long-chain acyl-CoA synthetase
MSEASPTIARQETIDVATAAPTVCGAFQVTARANAGQPALRNAQTGEIVMWDDYERRVGLIARGLHALGVRAGDPVAMLLRNRPEFNLVDTAALHLGAVPFSLYSTEPVEQLLKLVDDSGASVIVTEELFLDRALSVLERASGVVRLVVHGAVPSGERTMSLAELEQLSDDTFDFEATWRSVRPDDVATLVYTSGTTGASKAVQIPHRAIMHSLAGARALAPTTPGGHRGVSFLPHAHISDRFMCHYTTIGLGGTLTCVPDHELLWDALTETRPTIFHGVPRTFEKLVEFAQREVEADPALGWAPDAALVRVRAEQSSGPLDADDATRAADAHEALRPVREHLGLDAVEWVSVAAAPSSYAVLEYMHALGLQLAEIWGMTEFMMAIMNPPSKVKLGTVGIPLVAVEARLADDGELLLRGPHAAAGYRNDPIRSAAIFDTEGWVHSGDLASVDDDGYFRIIGRKKEVMINSSGKNLFPSKIEAVIKEASRLIGYATAIADRRRYVSALIVLDPTELEAFAAANGLQGSRGELAATPEVRAQVEHAVNDGNERLSRVEQVRAWRILDADWQPGGEEVTNTMKLRRTVIDQKYADVIEEMYTSG